MHEIYLLAMPRCLRFGLGYCRVHSSCKTYTFPEGRAKTFGDGETSFDSFKTFSVNSDM